MTSLAFTGRARLFGVVGLSGDSGDDGKDNGEVWLVEGDEEVEAFLAPVAGDLSCMTARTYGGTERPVDRGEARLDRGLLRPGDRTVCAGLLPPITSAS